MRIGELPKLAQTQNETIRYYGREDLLPEPSRSNANYRIMSKAMFNDWRLFATVDR